MHTNEQCLLAILVCPAANGDSREKKLTWLFVDQLSPTEIKELYGTRHIGRDQVRQLVGLMDVFCFSEVLLK
jgi:hypothetical protein